MPWKVNADDAKADGDVLVAIKLTEEEIAEQIREKEFDMGDTSAPRRLKITRADLSTHGYSARCDGCRAALAGRPAQNHSEECRRRVLEAIGKDDPRLGAHKQRLNEFLDKAATKEDSDEMQREKKRVRNEGPEGGRRFRRLQLLTAFILQIYGPRYCRTEGKSGFLKTMAETILTKHSWKLPVGRPATHLRF